MASTYLDLHFHIVFATKGRRSLIRDEWRPSMHAYLVGAMRNLGTTPMIVGGTSDHVHVLVGFGATHAMGDVVREIKKTSSAWAKSERGEREFAWQEGYAAFSVSARDRAQIAGYIANQAEHHRVRGSEEELLEMLREAEIAVDRRYFE